MDPDRAPPTKRKRRDGIRRWSEHKVTGINRPKAATTATTRPKCRFSTSQRQRGGRTRRTRFARRLASMEAVRARPAKIAKRGPHHELDSARSSPSGHASQSTPIRPDRSKNRCATHESHPCIGRDEMCQIRQEKPGDKRPWERHGENAQRCSFQAGLRTPSKPSRRPEMVAFSPIADSKQEETTIKDVRR